MIECIVPMLYFGLFLLAFGIAFGFHWADKATTEQVRKQGWSRTMTGYRVVGHIEKEETTSVWVKEDQS